jgi:hypothetical protein
MKRWINQFITKYRFKLLFLFTLLFLIVPAYFAEGILRDVITFFSLSFVFIQSLYIIAESNKKYRWVVWIFLLVLISTWFELVLRENFYVNLLRLLLYIFFFMFTIISLVRFIIKSQRVNIDVVIVTIVIYLLIGILGGFIAYFLYLTYPDSYNFSFTTGRIDPLDMVYFGFVTLSTLGYGDITPARTETFTLSYLLAVFGQLYVAIIIAIIVGKYLSHNPKSGK